MTNKSATLAIEVCDCERLRRWEWKKLKNSWRETTAIFFDVVENRNETFDMSELLPNKVDDLKEQLETWRQSLIRSAREVGCLSPPT